MLARMKWLGGALVLLVAITAGAAPAEKENIDWPGDLKLFEGQAPSAHVDLFHALKRGELHSMIGALFASAPHAPDRQMLAGLMRITSAIGDSHSGIHSIPPGLRFANVPIGVYLFADAPGVVAASPAQQDLLGGTIISINGHSAAEVVQRMKQLTEGTNDMSRSAFVVTRLVRPELLFYEGLAGGPDEYDVVVEKDGRAIVRKLHTLGRKADGSPDTGGLSVTALASRGSDWVSAAPASLPLWLQDRGKPFWFEEISGRSTLYIQDRGVQDEEGGQSFAAFFREAFDAIGKNRIVVLDLRLNGGGDNTLSEPLRERFKTLPAFQTRGRFFAIIGRLTQSAAQNLTTFLERNTKAIFVGEPTGESPNHFGDPELLQLPSSGISINLSRKRWNDSFPGDQRPWTAPTLPAPLTLRDFRAGRDPALEAIWKASGSASPRRRHSRLERSAR